MEVAEEDMRDIDRVDACLYHPVICSGALVEQEGVATDLDHIAPELMRLSDGVGVPVPSRVIFMIVSSTSYCLIAESSN